MFLGVTWVGVGHVYGIKEHTHLPFLFADPQLVEGAQARQYAPTEPPTIPTFRGIAWSVYLDLHPME